MKKPLALLAVAASATFSAFADTTATYTTGATSLADGKVTIAYDGSDKITSLSLNPASGETLTLTGDTLPFAAGAQIMPGKDGVSVVSNGFTTAGALTIGVTNHVWSSDDNKAINKDGYTTLFTNLRLDDISPIIATGNNMLQTDVNCQPYFVTRDGDTMTFQIHHRDTRTDGNTNNLRATKIELKQVGNDIQAKLLGNKTYKPCSLGYFIGLGWDIFDNPPESFGENNGTRSDYTSGNIFSIKRLEVGPRRETYTYTNGLLTASFDTVVAKNVRVEDLEVLYGASGYKHRIGSWSSFTLFPQKTELSDGVLSAWMENSWHTRCVKIELKQSGDDVVGRVVYAKSIGSGSSEGGDPDFDWDIGEGTTIRATPSDYSTNGYGCDMLVLRREAPSLLSFVIAEDVELPAISGGDVDVTFEVKESATDMMTRSFTRGLIHADYTNMFENVSIDDIVPSGAEGASGFERSPTYNETGIIADTIVRGETSGVKWMKFEIQNKGSYSDTADIVRSAYISLKQNGNNVDGKLLGFSYVRSDKNLELYNSAYGNAIFESTGGADGFSRKSGFSSYANYYEDGTATSGWGVKSLTVTGPRGYKVTAGGANTMTDSSFVVKSDGKNKIVYDVATKYALPPTFDCYGNATLNFSAAGGANDGAGKGTDVITMHEGTMLRTTVDYPFQYNQTQVVLDGATMIGDGSGKVYLSYMTLMNGAEIVRNSSDYRIGWNAPSPVWTVTGFERSVYSGELQLWGTNGGTKDTTIEVDETAEGADFLLDGDLAQSSDSKYPSAALIKTGVGTMEVTGTITLTTRGVYLKEGTLLLSKNDGLAAGTFFTMEGGTLALAANVADACASMSVNEDSALDLAAGASLTLDTVTVAESKTLSITAADGVKVKVNGTLDAATLSRIRLNGHRVMQSADGYLGTPGLTVIFW